MVGSICGANAVTVERIAGMKARVVLRTILN